MANWPVGTVVVATCVIIDEECDAKGHINGMRIVAKPGDLGIVFAHNDDSDSHEVSFEGGCFTSTPDDAAVKLFVGAVSTVCDGQPCHPEQKKLFDIMQKKLFDIMQNNALNSK